MLSNLEKYMFSNENLIRYTKCFNTNYTTHSNHSNKDNHSKKNQLNKYDMNTNLKNNCITPDEIDKLFWCFYIALNGIDKYLLEKSTHFKVEKDFKINSVTKVREKKSQLKVLKLKVPEIEDELVNKNKINIKTLSALALCHNLSFIVLLDDVYYDFNYNNDEYFIIEYIDKKGYSMYINLNKCEKKDKIKQIKDNKYLVDGNKVIKSISGYTLSEIQTIATKLKINTKNETGKNKLKKEIYENVIQKLGKLM